MVNLKNIFSKGSNVIDSKVVNIIFLLFLISFVLDRVINVFFHFPFFVVISIIMIPVLVVITKKESNKWQFYLLIFSFIIITILNSIIYLFNVKNISDLVFILLFITTYFLYKENLDSFKVSNVYIFFIAITFLFSFALTNPNLHSSLSKKYTSWLSWANTISGANTKELKTIEKENINLKWEKKTLDIVEYKRVHYHGLFRVPHVASYFFGFLFLFFVYQYKKNKSIITVVLLIVSLSICLFTGSRAIFAAFVLSLFVFLFQRKYILYLTILSIFGLLLLITIDYFLQLTTDTIFYQYFGFIKTISSNFTRLSRFRIWFSWWTEVKEFGVLDLLIGKSYINALIANNENLGHRIWFHNDFLNIFYTYGIVGITLYIWFFIKIYRDNRIIIKQNIFIFIFYFSMVFTAFLNGFYYYFPVFLLYLFFLMIKTEKQIVQ